MFTILAVIFGMYLLRRADRGNVDDRQMYQRELDEGLATYLQLHIRQDLKIVVFQLGGIIVMLGIIADLIGVRGLLRF